MPPRYQYFSSSCSKFAGESRGPCSSSTTRESGLRQLARDHAARGAGADDREVDASRSRDRSARSCGFHRLDDEARIVAVVVAERRLEDVLVFEAEQLPADAVAIAAVLRASRTCRAASAAASCRRTACVRPRSGTRSAAADESAANDATVGMPCAARTLKRPRAARESRCAMRREERRERAIDEEHDARLRARRACRRSE